ncbi:MAG: DoxX family protein [Bradymonadaceae bacterium]
MPIDITAIFVALPIVGLTAFGVYFLCASWAEDAAGATEPAPSSGESEQSQWVFTGATYLLALIYVVMGLPKLSALSDAVHQFTRHWGYSQTFMYVIGAAEFVGGIGLLIPKVRLAAAVGLSLIMGGAIYTHLAFDPALMVLIPTTCLALLVFVGYISYRRDWSDE